MEPRRNASLASLDPVHCGAAKGLLLTLTYFKVRRGKYWVTTMDIAPDPWHYPRSELARTFLRRFDPGPAEALTLFAQRRSGKTAFLKNDLATIGIEAKLQPVYIDLWAHLDDP